MNIENKNELEPIFAPKSEQMIYEQQKIEDEIKKVIDRLEIHDCGYIGPGEYDFNDIIEYIVNNSGRIDNICELVEKKQDEILFETDIFVSYAEIMKTAIIKGLEKFI